MKIGVLGSQGRLGSALVSDFGYFPISVDVTDINALAKAIHKSEVDVVVNCAAYTDVDGCEKDTKKAYNVNFRGAANLARCYKKPIIHISTDYIFNGKKGNYSEKAVADPLGYYGLTKLGAEQAIEWYSKDYTIVRTTILFGSQKKGDFIQGILRQLDEGKPFTVTTAFKGNPTYVRHLAREIDQLIHLPERPPIINLASSSILSRYELALMIADLAQKDKSLISPVATYSGIAERPKNAGLNTKLASSLGIDIYPAQTHVLDFLVDKRSW